MTNSKRKRQRRCNLPSVEWSIGTLLGLPLLLILLTGCAKDIVFHPIEKSDIQAVKEGEVVTAPKQGWFLSDFYLDEVLKAKVE